MRTNLPGNVAGQRYKVVLYLLIFVAANFCSQEGVAQVVSHQVTPEQKQQDFSNEYGTYVFSNFQVELKYPKGRLIQKNQKYEFVSEDSSISIHANVLKNDDNALWIQKYEQCLNKYKEKDVTFKVYKKEYFVVTGIEDGNVFYKRQIPFEINEKKYYLDFEMRFPQADKRIWDQILSACATSLKITADQSDTEKDKRKIGWSESENDMNKYMLIKQAEKWIDQTYKFTVPSSTDWSYCDKSEIAERRKHKVDELDVLFVDLGIKAVTQFILPVNDEYCGENDGSVRGFLLFTYDNNELNGEILPDSEGIRSAVGADVIEVPKMGKLLMLIQGYKSTSYWERVYLYTINEGKLNNVLSYTALDDIQGAIGYDKSILQPLATGDLRLLVWSTRDRDLCEGETRINGESVRFHEQIYHYDSNQGKYVQLGKDKTLSYEAGKTEWKSLYNVNNLGKVVIISGDRTFHYPHRGSSI